MVVSILTVIEGQNAYIDTKNANNGKNTKLITMNAIACFDNSTNTIVSTPLQYIKTKLITVVRGNPKIKAPNVGLPR